MTLTVFPCTRCGQCCRNVYLADATQYLDRGDGTCRHYDEAEQSCQIYTARPDICRVNLQYQMHYVSKFSWEEFVEVNVMICKQLQHQAQQ